MCRFACKKCKKCGQEKPLNLFYFRNDTGKYRPKCKKCHDEENTKNHAKNAEEIRIYNKKYGKAYRKVNRKALTQKEFNRKKTNIGYRLAGNIRSRVNFVLKNHTKPDSAIKCLGCSIEELILYIEQRFVSDMTWDNYGKWHIDHIIPLSSFDLTDKIQFAAACNYKNLQPLWAEDNLRKSNKII
jgi:hypothetical protein